MNFFPSAPKSSKAFLGLKSLFQTQVLISRNDQEGNKLQRQKILIFICTIYYHHWRNVNTINSQKWHFIKIRPVGTELLHAGGRMDGRADGIADGRADGQIEMRKLAVAFSNFAKVTKKRLTVFFFGGGGEAKAVEYKRNMGLTLCTV